LASEPTISVTSFCRSGTLRPARMKPVHEQLALRERRAAHEVIAFRDLVKDHLREKSRSARHGVVDARDVFGDGGFFRGVEKAGGNGAVIGGHGGLTRILTLMLFEL